MHCEYTTVHRVQPNHWTYCASKGAVVIMTNCIMALDTCKWAELIGVIALKNYHIAGNFNF